MLDPETGLTIDKRAAAETQTAVAEVERAAAETRAAVAETRADAAEARADSEQARAGSAETRADAEREGRLAAEARVRQLEEQLRRQQANHNKNGTVRAGGPVLVQARAQPVATGRDAVARRPARYGKLR